MRDRGAERACGCSLRVDVDPLRIVGRLGETVDALLLDLAPLGEELLPDESWITI